MSKKIIRFLVPALVFLPIMVLAQTEGFKVAGEIKFKKTGDLFVELVTEDEFAMDKASDWQAEAKLRM